MVNPKRKGGAYERKVAKELSFWIFDDCDVLRRHPDSGATKIIWSGDVVPMKQLPDNWHGHFPILIETKTGYDKHYPDFWAYAKLKDWFDKAVIESKIHNQEIIMLICQFKNRRALFTTNQFIDPTHALFNVCFPTIVDNELVWAYTYNYADILSLDFYKLFNIEKFCQPIIID